MTLFDCKIGDNPQIIEINLNEDVKRRFEVLGMTSLSKVNVVNKKHNGAMIINIRGTRFAIGKNFAKGIVVREEQE